MGGMVLDAFELASDDLRALELIVGALKGLLDQREALGALVVDDDVKSAFSPHRELTTPRGLTVHFGSS
jgi:hypothetical protein